MQLPYRKPPKLTQYQNDPLITRAKFLELQKKLAQLFALRPQVATEVNRLAQNGDFSENAEYQMAKGRLRGINEHIDRLEFQLGRAEIIENSATDTVQVGHTVTVEINGAERVYNILGSSETNPAAGVISHNSPIGAALIGRSVGDDVVLQLVGRTVTYKILKIE